MSSFTRDKRGRVRRADEVNHRRWLTTPTVPLLPQAQWTAVNVSTTTWVHNRDGSVTLTTPASGVTSNRCWVRTAPATPWTVVANVSVLLINTSWQQAGILVREAASGELHTLTIYQDGTVRVSRWTDATTFLSHDYEATWPTLNSYWFRITDDGTDTAFYLGSDDLDWQPLFDLPRTTFMTPNQYGIVANENTGVAGVVARFRSLEVS